jgi:RNA-directed DNA polymerase
MNPNTKKSNRSIYYPSKEDQWAGINWPKVEETIAKLQNRIAKAADKKNPRKVRDLQRLLVRGFSGRLKIVQQVSQTTRVKKNSKVHPVQNKTLNLSNPQRFETAFVLKRRTSTKVSNRVFIPKPTLKNFEVPCLKSSIRQSLWDLALYPAVVGQSNHFFDLSKCSSNLKEAKTLSSSFQNGVARQSQATPSFEDLVFFTKEKKQMFSLLNQPACPPWVLKVTIEKNSETSSHDWLLTNTPVEKKLLKIWLKPKSSGSRFKLRFFEATPGLRLNPNSCFTWSSDLVDKQNFTTVPTQTKIQQSLTTTLESFALKGLEHYLKTGEDSSKNLINYRCHNDNHHRNNCRISGFVDERSLSVDKVWKSFSTKPSVDGECFSIKGRRYGSDFIFTGFSPLQLDWVSEELTKFLKPRGLQLKDSQVKLTPLADGFDFLAWNFRRYSNGKLLVRVSKQNLLNHRKEIKYIIKTTSNPYQLISKLNLKIRNWVNYHQDCNGFSKLRSQMNTYLSDRLMKWGQKRHGNKTKKWIFKRYWFQINDRWTFSVENLKFNSQPTSGKTSQPRYILIHYDYL